MKEEQDEKESPMDEIKRIEEIKKNYPQYKTFLEIEICDKCGEIIDPIVKDMFESIRFLLSEVKRLQGENVGLRHTIDSYRNSCENWEKIYGETQTSLKRLREWQKEGEVGLKKLLEEK